MTNKILIITESTEYKNYLKYYPNQAYGIATGGHIYQAKKDDELNPLTLAPNYEPMKDKKELIKRINDLGNKVSDIYLCSDPDLEGEWIAYCVYDALSANNKKKAHRIAFNDWSKASIDKQFKGVGNKVPVPYMNTYSWLQNRDKIGIYTNKALAQQYRVALDILFGFGLSRYIRKQVAGAKSLGRVQSVPLILLYLRNQAIKDFKKVKSVGLDYIIPTSNLVISLTQTHPDFQNELKNSVIDDPKSDKVKFINQNIARNYVKNFLPKNEFLLKDIAITQKSLKPALPYDTLTLNKEVSSMWGWKIPKINDMLQVLYEKGWTTYPRTDSNKLDPSFCQQAITFLSKEYPKTDLNIQTNADNYFFNKTNSASQEGHFAISQVDMNNTPEVIKNELYQENDSKFSSAELFKLYCVIYERTKLAFFKDSINENYKYTFINNHSIFTGAITNNIYPGWKKYDKSIKIDAKTETKCYTKGKTYQASNFNTLGVFKEYETHPPKPFTWPTLIDVLKKHQIGRPSTLKMLTSIVEERGYTKGGEGKTPLVLTPLGEMVACEIVKNLSDLINLTFTKEQYKIMDDIQLGENLYEQELKHFLTHMNKILVGLNHAPYVIRTKQEKQELKKEQKQNLNMLNKKCPKCGAPLVMRTSHKNPKKQFIGCSQYPKCDYVEWIDDKNTVKDGFCPKCAGQLRIVRYWDKKTNQPKKAHMCKHCDWKDWNVPLDHSDDVDKDWPEKKYN